MNKRDGEKGFRVENWLWFRRLVGGLYRWFSCFFFYGIFFIEVVSLVGG